ALLTGRPLRTDDYTNDPAVGKEYLGAVVRDDSVSAMVVPIKSEARVVGLLYVANRSRRPFGDRDEATLLRLADEAAVAIRHAQLFASERESERRYRTLVESSIQGIHIQRDWVTLFVNPAFARMLGYDGADELVGLDTRRWLAPHELARLDSDRAARLRGEAVPSRDELQAGRRHGSLILGGVQVAGDHRGGEPAGAASAR